MKLFSLHHLKAGTGILFLSLLCSGCADLINQNSIYDAEYGVSSSNQTVPKAQYDELLQKYENLQKAQKANNTMVSETSSSDVVENLVQSTEINSGSELNDTVDLFASPKQEVKGASRSSTRIDVAPNPDEVGNELLALRKANRLINERQYTQAMAQLKGLEDSGNLQIQVRAKFLIGEILFRQKNFDLASQVYENIVHNYAFSGVVLEALQRLIVCSEKLNQPKKKELYFSMLHDFF